MTQEKIYVSYEEFGAVGDGISDDLPAIATAHEYANKEGRPVRAKDGATYYLGGKNITAIIMTDVNFGEAKFIIDDRTLENRAAPIFRVVSANPTFVPEITTLNKGQKKIDFPHNGRTYVRVFNSELRIFKRKGENANNGVDASDCFVVDETGNIENSIDWDYPVVSRAYAKCIDDAPITIEGGTFTTIANQHERVYAYHNRGFNITRSNTTVKNIKHYIEGEGEDGAPYASFFGVNEAVDVTISDCLLTPHKTYMTKDSNPPTHVNRMGSYELGFNSSIRTRLVRVTQSRDINDRAYWGLIGTNFCKEIYIEGCEMSRFDAHMGVSSTTIKDSRIGHMCLLLIGYGEFYIENSHVLGNSFIGLRGDYGSFWHGNITVKNCSWTPMNKKSMEIISAVNTGDHDFGYECRMPENILIDGLRVYDGDVESDVRMFILPNYDGSFSEGKPYAYVPTKRLVARNIVSDSGRAPEVCNNPEQYKGILAEIG